MSDINTNMADLESDDMSMAFAGYQTDLAINPQYQAARNRNYSGSDSGSDSGKEESNIDSSNILSVFGSANTTTVLESDDMSMTTAVPTRDLSDNQPARNRTTVLESDDMSMTTAVPTQDLSDNQPARNRTTVLESDDMSMTTAVPTRDLSDNQPARNRTTVLESDDMSMTTAVPTRDLSDNQPTFASRHWRSDLSAHIMANAGMIYKGHCKNGNGEIVYVIVECCECRTTMYFKPDEDPLAEHRKLNPTCKIFRK